jgi:hypothetical protein
MSFVTVNVLAFVGLNALLVNQTFKMLLISSLSGSW